MSCLGTSPPPYPHPPIQSPQPPIPPSHPTRPAPSSASSRRRLSARNDRILQTQSPNFADKITNFADRITEFRNRYRMLPTATEFADRITEFRRQLPNFANSYRFLPTLQRRTRAHLLTVSIFQGSWLRRRTKGPTERVETCVLMCLVLRLTSS